MGFNLGVSPELFDTLSARMLAVRERYGQPVVLVGWSLGGCSRASSPSASRGHCQGNHDGLAVLRIALRQQRLAHLPPVAGHAVDEPPVEARLSEKPPVETVAIWSPRDGIVSPRASRGRPGERDRAIAVRCTHVGFPNSPETHPQWSSTSWMRSR